MLQYVTSVTPISPILVTMGLQINRYVMLVVFFIPLSIIAVYEAELDPAKNKWVKDWLSHPDEGDEDNERHQNPEAGSEDAEHGLEISKVLFEDIVKVFPDTTQVGLLQ